MSEIQVPPSSRKRELTVAALGALALACALCAPRWIEGKSVYSGVIQEQYYILGQYSFDHQIIADFKATRFPLWNPNNALGTPLLGNMLSSVFYPLKVLVYIFNTHWMRDLFIVLRLWLAGFFVFVFARSRGMGRAGALAVMAGFTLTGYFRVFINENYLNADILVPLLLISFDRLARSGRLRNIILAGLVIFAVINNGHPEAAFYTILFGGLYFIAAVIPHERNRIAPAFVRLGSSFTIGFILSLPMLMPFIEYWSRGLHFHPPGAGFYHYPVRQGIALLSPWFFKQADPGAPFLGPVNMAWSMIGRGIPEYSITEVPWLIPHIGVAVAFLAIISLVRLRSLGASAVFFVVFSVFFLGVMFGLPGFNLIGFLPVFDFSGNFKHAMPAVSFSLTFLAGKTVDDIAGNRVSLSQVLAAVVLVIFIIAAFAFIHEPLPAGRDYINPEIGVHMIILLCLALWLAAASRWRAPPWLVGAVSVFSIVSGLMLDSLWHKGFEPDYLGRMRNTRALDHLARAAGPFRTYIFQGIMPPNLNIPLGLSDLRVMDGVNDSRFVNTINEINKMDRLESFDYWYANIGYLQPRPEAVDHPLLKLLNVRYLVSDNPLPWQDTIPVVLEKGFALAPSPGHLGRSRMPFGEGFADALYQHPPCRVDIDVSDPFYTRLSFRPAVDPRALHFEKDGVWFSVQADSENGTRTELLYSRYIHPGTRPADRNSALTSLEIDEYCIHLSFSTLPNEDTDYDWSGWSNLRLISEMDPGLQNYRLTETGRVWLYQSSWHTMLGPTLDRAFLAGWAEVLPGEENVLKALANPLEPFQSKVYLSGTNLAVPHTAPLEWKEEWDKNGGPGKVDIEYYSPQRIKMKARAAFDCWLVVSDLYYPGWSALVDGLACRIFRGDYLLRAIPLKAGSRTVELIYKPASFRIGLWFSLVTLAALALASLLRRAFPGSESVVE